MKAITLHQPWASLVACGVKTIETRSWPAPKGLIGGRVAIHAGKGKADHWDPVWEAARSKLGGEPGFVPDGIRPLVFGAIVASAVLEACVPMVANADENPESIACLDVGGNGQFGLLYADEQVPYGDFAPGRWAWLLTDIKPTTERCPACWGRKARQHRIEGGSVNCGHCNRCFTFNMMRDQGPHVCGCREAQLDRACTLCHGAGNCAPVPAKGAQRVWNWNPE